MSALAWVAAVAVALVALAVAFGAGYITAAIAASARVEELERELTAAYESAPSGDHPWET